jgi:probable O-glycosylation ligase (exosortase A-associated)
MRGIVLGITFFSLLPFIFIKGPFFGILMWYWVSLMTPQLLVWKSFFAAIPYALIVAVATLLSWLLSREPKLPPGDRLTALFLLWMIWISITSFFGSGPQAQVLQYWLVTEKMLLMTVVAYALTNTRERIDQLIVVCALSVGFFGFKGGLWVLLTGGSAHIKGPGGLLGGNNELGVALTMMLPLMFYLRQRYSGTRFKWPLQALIALNVIADLFTYSRGALLGISAMLAMAWLRSRHKLLSAMAVVTLAAGVFVFAPPQWTARMHTIENYQKVGSAVARLYLWRLAWAMTLKHPILGGGFHWSYNPATVAREFAGSGFHWPFVNRTIVAHSDLPPLIHPRAMHSIWFEALSDHGFPGLVLFFAFGLFMLFDARWLMRRTRDRPDLDWANNLGRMMQASLVGFAVGGTFASMYYYDGFYVIVVITAAARRVVAADLAKAAAPAARAVIARPPRSRRPLRPRPIAGAGRTSLDAPG